MLPSEGMTNVLNLEYGMSSVSPHSELLCVSAIKAWHPGHISLIHLSSDKD